MALRRPWTFPSCDTSHFKKAFTSLPSEAFPNLAAVGGSLYVDLDARFRHGLDLLIESLDRRRPK